MIAKAIKIAIFQLLVVSPLINADSEVIINPSSGHAYQRIDSSLSWHSANEYCQNNNAYLATITSLEENTYIYDNLVKGLEKEPWLGGTDENNEGVWKWVTGEAWDYTNWAFGEPNNDPTFVEENYLTFHWGYLGEWNDISTTYSFICEWNPYDNTIVTHCVSNEEELQNALDVASGNYADDLIKLIQGLYLGNFIYGSTKSFSLSIQGGYTDNCLSRELDPTNTILDGNLTNMVLALSAPSVNVNFNIEGLTLRKGNRVSGTGQGGGLFANNAGVVTVSESIFEDNSASSQGGGMFIQAEDSLLKNNLFRNNSSSWRGGALTTSTSHLTLNENKFSENKASADGGGIDIYAATANISKNIFSNNTVAFAGAGAYINISDAVYITDNIIQDNIASYSSPFSYNSVGGGLFVAAGTASMINNQLNGNRSSSGYYDSLGGGAYVTAKSAKVINNTIGGNSSSSFGGGLYLGLVGEDINNTSEVFNNIFYNNGSDKYTASDLYIANDLNSDFIPSSLIMLNNNFDHEDTGFKIDLSIAIDPSNLNRLDPLFADPNNDDYHLHPGSPMINAGYPGTPDLPLTDIVGGLRIVGGLVDIGAYEYHEYEFCDLNEIILDNETIGPGGDNYSSEVGIETNGIVTISSDADVVLTAPVIRLNPGLRVETGAQLLLRAQTVNCPL